MRRRNFIGVIYGAAAALPFAAAAQQPGEVWRIGHVTVATPEISRIFAQALEQGRSVYAVPGHINAPSAQGSNRLIQQGAKLVMDASDLLDDLQILLPETKPSPEAAVRSLPLLTDDERRVYDSIEATETSIDDIATKSELPSGTVSSTLLRLELKRLVKQLPGKYFVKLA